MYQIDFNHPLKVHFIGIGGISMSGLAEILMSKGFSVTGSDMKESGLTKKLQEKGARILIGHRPENLEADVSLVVYTAAVHPDNTEYKKAMDLQIPLIPRADLLGQIMKNYPLPIAISGTHGKTTTTSMISEILLGIGTDPTLSIGGVLPSINSNLHIGTSPVFVTEACEYTNSFLSFFPKIAVILNIEEDHLDFFKDLEDIRNSFHKFAQLLPEDGILIINEDIPDLEAFTKDLKCKVFKFGTSNNADLYSSEIIYDENACGNYQVNCNGSTTKVQLQVPGKHNIINSLAALSIANALNIPLENAASALSEYHGAIRRFQHKGTLGGITIVDDYAHHPTEITTTLETARNLVKNKLWVVFQPHTYSRTKALLPDFVKALSLADHVVLADVYAAREKDVLGVNSQTLYDELLKTGCICDYFHSFDEIENFLLENCINGDLLITMGAGDVVEIGESLLGI